MKVLSGKKAMKNKEETIIRIVVSILLIICCCVLIYPFIYVFSASISSPKAVEQNKIAVFPVGPVNLEAYKVILNDERIWRGYGNTIFYTFFGVLINIVVTVLAAYPMSRREFRGRKFMNIFVSATMFISTTGLLIPLYLIVRELRLIDSRLSVLIVFAAFPFFIILMRSFFESIPESLIEAARIDGLGELGILMKIVLPLSGAALATIGLYYGINRWNGYFWAMIFLTDPNKYPLQVILRELIVQARMGAELDFNLTRNATTAVSIQYAAIFVSTVPMLVIYPWIQKYFVKGVMVGSIKG